MSGDNKIEPKYTCACKKIKISVTAQESVIVENDNCVHLYLLMAAILSNDSISEEFKQHTDLFLLQSSPQKETEAKVADTNNTEFNFNSYPDFTDNDFENSLNNENIALIDVANLIDYNPNAMDTAIENYDTNTIEGLELTDCQIELMDQFKLTDQIDLCHSEIELTDADLMSESLNAFPPLLIENDNGVDIVEEKLDVQFDVDNTCGQIQESGNDVGGICIDAVETSFEFDAWLSFVVERINSSMDFNSNGFVNNLVFHVSHVSVFLHDLF